MSLFSSLLGNGAGRPVQPGSGQNTTSPPQNNHSDSKEPSSQTDAADGSGTSSGPTSSQGSTDQPSPSESSGKSPASPSTEAVIAEVALSVPPPASEIVQDGEARARRFAEAAQETQRLTFLVDGLTSGPAKTTEPAESTEQAVDPLARSDSAALPRIDRSV
ncbi:MAG: hypothetical protein AB8B82_03425 [Roseovarius sp.]